MAPDTILGRQRERVVVARLFEGAGDGSAALRIEGEAGIGKTTLWLEGVRIAERRGRVLVARASGAETALSLAVFGDLFEPVFDDLAALLPAPQRAALAVALLKEEPSDATPDARAIGLAALTALRELARRQRVTIAIDDVQWIDRPSARALAFALRRLQGDRVTVLTARRVLDAADGSHSADGGDDPLELSAAFDGRVERLELGPMDPQTLAQLLRDRRSGDFPHPLAMRIHETTAGNPFYALEVGRAMSRGEERPTPTEPLPIPANLQVLLRDRIDTLSDSARDILMATAASAHATVPLVTAFGDPSGLDEAERSGLLVIDGDSVAFTHPLLASAVYGQASTGQRRTVHRRLAEIIGKSEERARHLALSITGTDARVANELETAATAARDRGAPQAAAELLQLSVALTPAEQHRDILRRRTFVAGNLFDAGDTLGARAYAVETLQTKVPGRDRADALFMLSIMHWNDARHCRQLLAQALEEVGDADDHLRSRILADLGWAAYELGEFADAEASVRAALDLAEGIDDPFVRRLPLSVLGAVLFVVGRHDESVLRRAVAEQGPLVHAEASTPATVLAMVSTWANDLERARSLLMAELERLRAQGHESACWEILMHLAEVEMSAGRTREADRLANESFEIAVDAGLDDVLDQVFAVRTRVRTVRGDVEGARADAIEALAMADRFGSALRDVECRSILGLLELSLDDAEAALGWLGATVEQAEGIGVVDPGVSPHRWDAIDALVALGRLDEAEDLLQVMEDRARPLGREIILGVVARGRGLLAAGRGDLTEALTHLERAVFTHESTSQPFELGRSLLVMGEIQRRQKQKRAARETLERARSVFDEMVAPLWSKRADRELARIGGRRASGSELTPTESQVAGLVAAGRTNREVADALFVSVHTVEANLKRIYRKLQVRSRTELARKL